MAAFSYRFDRSASEVDQESPVIMPVVVSISIPMYAGTEGRPGIVLISPVRG